MEKEKKAKSELDKTKRKLEGDLKTTLGSLKELEQVKYELEGILKKKDQEIHNLSSKVEDVIALSNGLNKKLKDMQVSLKSLKQSIFNALNNDVNLGKNSKISVN